MKCLGVKLFRDKISQKPLGHAHVPSYDDERCSESLPSNVYELIKESFEDAERMTDECNATKSLEASIYYIENGIFILCTDSL